MDIADASNYYESLVDSYLTENTTPMDEITDYNLLKDITCLALNMLPSHYIRHSADMAFFPTDKEHELMKAKVCLAVDSAIETVIARPR